MNDVVCLIVPIDQLSGIFIQKKKIFHGNWNIFRNENVDLKRLRWFLVYLKNLFLLKFLMVIYMISFATKDYDLILAHSVNVSTNWNRLKKFGIEEPDHHLNQLK